MISFLRAILSRIRSIFTLHKLDDDFTQELESHFELLTQENLRKGMSPAEARRVARLKLGSEPALRETHHDQRTIRWLESFGQDLRFAFRMLRKNPGFTAVAVLTLALGIGATTSMFTILDGIVLKPLQYPDANRIVTIDTRWPESGKEIPRTTGGDIQDLRGVNAFDAFSFYSGGQVGIQLSRSAEYGGVFTVDPNFFRVFSVAPIAGRTFVGAEDSNHSAVVSAGFAKNNFGSAQAALGQTLGIQNTAYQIVGVMPPMFQYPGQAQVWAAIPRLPDNLHRTAFNYRSVAKLASGVSVSSADLELAALGNRLATAFPNSNRGKIFVAQPLQDQLAAPVRSTLILLMAAVALVLLIACANVANLMLARATARVREIAMRAVLGAGRWRIVAQLLLESMVLALVAAVLGIGVAVWTTRELLVIGKRFVPGPLLSDIQFDWRVLAFAIAVAVFTSILFGLAPAWQACRIDLQKAIKQSSSHGLLGGTHSGLRNSLVIAQIALSLTLAVGAGLLIRTLVALQRSQLGFQTEGILVVYADAPARTLPEALDAGRTFDDLFARLRRLPGVVSSAGAMGLPAGQYSSDGSFAIEGKNSFNLNSDGSNLPHAGFRLASPGYFAAMGIPLLRGRDFDDGDLYDRPFAAIISESLAREDFPNENPIGHRIMCGLDSPNWMTVVGVVGDVRQSSPAAQPGPELYMPLRQHPFHANEAEVVVRTVGNPNQLVPSVQQTVHAVDPQMAIRFTTMSDLVSDSIGTQRFRTVLASIFASLALLLALSGMYAVMNYITAQRTSEFGLRSALGAQQGNLLLLVLRGAAGFAGTGVAIGVFLSVASSRFLASMLFGVKSLDVATYAVVIAIVVPVVLLASAIPAWRVSRADPVTALRSE